MSTAIKSHDSAANAALDALLVDLVLRPRRDGRHHAEVRSRSGKLLGTVEPADTEDGPLFAAVTGMLESRLIGHYPTRDIAALAVVKEALDQ